MAGLLDYLQGASNSAAGSVSFPVDALAWALRKAGVPVGDAPIGGSNWMEQQGLTKPVPQRAQVVGDIATGLLGITAAAKAPQIARGLLSMGDNLAAPRTMNPQTGAVVWHGSPHKFDKFDASKIGTGEGAQAYGHGLYLADHPETAMTYQPRDPKFERRIMSAYKQAEARGQYPVMEVHEAYLLHKTPTEVQAMIDGMEGVSVADKAAALAAHKLGQQQYAKQTAGALYKVDLPDEQIAKMLDWDKPLSQQAPEVQKAIAPVLDRMKSEALQPAPGWGDLQGTAPDVDALLKQLLKGGPETASELRNRGVPGIRYLDGGSRGAGAGTSNYVVFPGNEDLLKILERNGKPLGLLGE